MTTSQPITTFGTICFCSIERQSPERILMKSPFALAKNILIAVASFSAFALSVVGIFHIATTSGRWVLAAVAGLLWLAMVSVFICSCAVSNIMSKGTSASPG